MNGVSKVKVVLGYALLLGVMFFSLFFVRREMDNLMHSDAGELRWTDSLVVLLKEKDANTIHLLRTLSQANDRTISTGEVEEIIARQDSVVAHQWVKRRVIAHRDTLVTRAKKKGFFRRLGEVFSPSKKDTTIEVKTSLEYANDTLIAPFNPVDSLQERLREVSRNKEARDGVVERRKRRLERLDDMLRARIDSLLKDYEMETTRRVRSEAERQQFVRRHSARVLGGIAVGAVLLSVVFLFVIGRDITRSNRYRRELEEARRCAEDLLATRERLMLAITHDFKAPLGSIMGYADLLSRLTVDDRQLFYLDTLKASSEHLLKLVVDLLDFHRLELHKAEVNRVSFHPSRLLEEICVSFEPLAAGKNLMLSCDVASELESTFICDPLRLRQIISNLLSNAVKFTDEGGIAVGARYENRELVVAVSDTGRGMSVADSKRVFQEFTRLPNAQGKEGFGLGLSIVQMLVQLLDGRIEVDSVSGKGSTFTLYIPIFPVTGSRTKEAYEASKMSEELPMRDEECGQGVMVHSDGSSLVLNASLKRVLLIDDDCIQLRLTAAMLGQSGIEAVCCAQVDELLNALRGGEFDVLLSDVQMPAMNGFELLHLLRSCNIVRARTIPVVAVTARGDISIEDFIAHGFSGCLRKPFTVAELLKVAGSVSHKDECAEHEEPQGEGNPHSNESFRFEALTAFSVDDSEAAHSILESFLAETQLNAQRLEQAAHNGDAALSSAVAHKMIPLFTLIEASALVDVLRELEAGGGASFNSEIEERVAQALGLIEEVMSQCRKTMQ